jgi:hypothetical protein
MPVEQPAFLPEAFPFEQLAISASRLKVIGGEKGAPGCERKYAGAYLFDMRQSGSAATELGKEVHGIAELHQETGVVANPESRAAQIYRAGAHMVGVEHLEHICGPLLVEHEHVGQLPDGTWFLARIDGHSPCGSPQTATLVIQDLKTTSGEEWALNADPDSPKFLGKDLQALFYDVILLCFRHWFCKPLPDGHYGPPHWQVWDPVERNAKVGRLRWLYFKTKGTPRAWDVSTFIGREEAAARLADTIMPLVEKIVAIHQHKANHPEAALSDFRQDTAACSGRGKWCGAYERDACDFGALGTPIIQLRKGNRMSQPSAAERLAALKNRVAGSVTGGTPAAAAPTPAPKAPEAVALVETAPASTPEQSEPSKETGTAPSDVKSVSASSVAPTVTPAVENVESSASASTSAPAATGTDPAPKRGRGRPRTTPPPADNGAGINPPESAAVLAKLTAQAEGAAADPAGALAAFPSDVLIGEVIRRALATQKALGL